MSGSVIPTEVFNNGGIKKKIKHTGLPLRTKVLIQRNRATYPTKGVQIISGNITKPKRLKKKLLAIAGGAVARGSSVSAASQID